MDYEQIRYAVDDGLLTITLHRRRDPPPRRRPVPPRSR